MSLALQMTGSPVMRLLQPIPFIGARPALRVLVPTLGIAWRQRTCVLCRSSHPPAQTGRPLVPLVCLGTWQNVHQCSVSACVSVGLDSFKHDRHHSSIRKTRESRSGKQSSSGSQIQRTEATRHQGAVCPRKTSRLTNGPPAQRIEPVAAGRPSPHQRQREAHVAPRANAPATWKHEGGLTMLGWV